MLQPDRTAELSALLEQRLLILDGAMGTMIQSYRLQETDYRGERFRDWPRDLKGNNDLLVLTQPAIIQAIFKGNTAVQRLHDFPANRQTPASADGLRIALNTKYQGIR